jgi:hypothetical protein
VIFGRALAAAMCLPIACMAIDAAACTVEGSRLADSARAKQFVGTKAVRGIFMVDRVERESPDREYPMHIFGTITAKDGRRYETVHDDDGTIVLCSVFFTPKDNAEGRFYLDRGSPPHKLVHWNLAAKDAGYIEPSGKFDETKPARGAE